MDKIIFLDIDGVLNCSNTFKETKGIRKIYGMLQKNSLTKEEYFNLLLKEELLKLDYNKIFLLKEIVNYTGAKIVIASSWTRLSRYPYIEEKLINLGLPIIDSLYQLGGKAINDYIHLYNVKEYIIIDDSRYSSYTLEQRYNMVWTNYYQEGLNEENVYDAINILGLKK